MIAIAIVDDEPKLPYRIPLSRTYGYIKINTVTINAADGNFAAAPGIVFCGGVPSVKGPASVGAIGPVIVNPHVAGWDWVRTRGRLTMKHGNIARNNPALAVFSNFEILIGAGFFGLIIVAIVNDKAELSSRSAVSGSYGDIKVDAERIGSGNCQLA